MTDIRLMTEPQIRFLDSRRVVEVMRTRVSAGLDNQLTIPQAAIVWDLLELAAPPIERKSFRIAARIISSDHVWRVIIGFGRSGLFQSSSHILQK